MSLLVIAFHGCFLAEELQESSHDAAKKILALAIMNIEINGKIVESSIVTANYGMQFGQFRNVDLKLDSYKLSIGKSDFIELFEKYFIQVRDEIQADDIACIEESEFTDSGYGDLEEMFSYKADLSEIISTYIERKIFEVLLPLEVTVGYVINSIDSVEVTDSQINITGRTYRWPVNKNNQK